MTPELAIGIARHALLLTLMIAAPMLTFGLVVGLVISVFQAVTQINEMTLTFIPKIVAVVAAVVIFLPWMLSKMVGFTTQILVSIPQIAQ